MRDISTLIVGAGQAGLAMSHCLSQRSIEHVLLERGQVANSWRTERWDSLRLLTPNWQSRLPGFTYTGDQPDGYRSMPQTIDFLAGYAHKIAAPVEMKYDLIDGFQITEIGAYDIKGIGKLELINVENNLMMAR